MNTSSEDSSESYQQPADGAVRDAHLRYSAQLAVERLEQIRLDLSAVVDSLGA